MALYIESIPNRAGKPAILLRQAWREGKRIRKKTIANLSKLPPGIVEGFRAVLKGAVAVNDIGDLLHIKRSLPHGHAVAVLGTARELGLERIIHRIRSRERQLALAAIVSGVISPDSNLNTARRLSQETATDSLGTLLGLGPVTGDEITDMLDWLLRRQTWIERSLANRQLGDGGTLILHNVSSSYLNGWCRTPTAFGHSHDGKDSRPQIAFGLLCASEGCPVAVEVFAGNTFNPSTVTPQVRKFRKRFGIERVVLVGERGMLTSLRIREVLEQSGLDLIPSLRTEDIRRLLEFPDPDTPVPLEPEALVPDMVAEITGPDFPGERLMVCLNPRLREKRAREREKVLQATEETLKEVAASVLSGRLRDPQAIDRQVNRVINRWKVARYFDSTVTDGGIIWNRREGRIAAEARLDGIYVIRNSLDAEAIEPKATVETHMSAVMVERTFRNAKIDLGILPVGASEVGHLRAHAFLGLLVLYVEWQVRRRLAPLLSEADSEAALDRRNAPVASAVVLKGRRAKVDTNLNAEGLPTHSLRTLLDDLATLTLNQLRLPGHGDSLLSVVTTPTLIQNHALQLLGISLDREFPTRLKGTSEPSGSGKG